jgi:hypothetical protein
MIQAVENALGQSFGEPQVVGPLATLRTEGKRHKKGRPRVHGPWPKNIMSEVDDVAVRRLNGRIAALALPARTLVEGMLGACRKRSTREIILRLDDSPRRPDGKVGAFLQTAEMRACSELFDQLDLDELREVRNFVAALPSPKPRAKTIATKPRKGARLKEAIRQAKRENPHPLRQLEIAEAADRLLGEWGVNFKDECPRRWRHKKSLVQAFNDPKLNQAVKKYISTL